VIGKFQTLELVKIEELGCSLLFVGVRERKGVVSAQFLAEVSNEDDGISLHGLRVIKCEWKHDS
jgi:hypothetical protein